jgi:hypothetical protein
VRFYYDSKAAIPYKALLRESDNRKKRIRVHWGYSIVAANSVGCTLYPPINADDYEPIIELPVDDMTYHSFTHHPPYLPLAMGISKTPKSRALKLDKYPRPSSVLEAERRLRVQWRLAHEQGEDELALPSFLEDALAESGMGAAGFPHPNAGMYVSLETEQQQDDPAKGGDDDEPVNDTASGYHDSGEATPGDPSSSLQAQLSVPIDISSLQAQGQHPHSRGPRSTAGSVASRNSNTMRRERSRDREERDRERISNNMCASMPAAFEPAVTLPAYASGAAYFTNVDRDINSRTQVPLFSSYFTLFNRIGF